MSKEKTNDQLIQERVELEKKAETLQVEAAERKFEINFSDQRMIKTVMEHLDKHYTWKTADAAVLVTLYENIKKQNKAYTTSNETPEVYAIGLRGHELNALYQALLNVEGTGIENARRFITMLTQIGEAVGTAMQDLSTMNTTLNDLHAELAEIDAQLDADANVEVVSPELETVKSTK